MANGKIKQSGGQAAPNTVKGVVISIVGNTLVWEFENELAAATALCKICTKGVNIKMANGKIKQPIAASKAPIKKAKKAAAGGTSRGGQAAPNTAKGVVAGRRDAAGKF